MGRTLLFCLITLFSMTAFSQSKITVDKTKEYQTISGFGSFGGIKPYNDDPPYYTDDFVDLLLNDLGTTIIRTNVFWDLEPSNDNSSPYVTDLAKFNSKPGSNLAKQLPYYKALKKAGLKKIIASIWTPPIWMKANPDNSLAPFCNGQCGGTLNTKFYDEFAEYCVAYTKILSAEGIDLYALSIQNELRFDNPFESCVYSPEQYRDVLKIVKQRFKKEGITTKIFGPEDMGKYDWNLDWGRTIFADNEARESVDIWAVHTYIDGVAPDYGSAEGWTSLSNYVSKNNNKPLWMTETSGYEQTTGGAIKLSQSMYLALKFGNISSWVYWQTSEQPGSTYAMMGDGQPTPLYYAAKHFYKFIRPGAIRIEAQSEDPEVLSLAFKNPRDGAMTILLINASDAEKQIHTHTPGGPPEFTVFRTTAADQCRDLGKMEGNLTLPPQSIHTLIGYGPAAPSLEELPNYFLPLGKDTTLRVPITNISSGDSNPPRFEAVSSNPSVVAAPVVVYENPQREGYLVLKPNTSAPGKSEITLTLTNSNAADNTTFSFNTTSVTFTVEVIDLVTEINEGHDTRIKIYPNPTESDQVKIDLSQITGPATIHVTDMRSQLIYEKVAPQSQELLISTQNWSKGIYVIKVFAGSKQFTEKLWVK